MNFLDSWVLQPSYLPAWLQAAAAVVALAISVYAVRYAGAGERRRAALELRGMIVAIFPEIGMLEVSARSVRTRLDAIKEHCADQVGQSVAATVQIQAHIETPPMLDRYTDKLFLLGEVAGPSCLHLVRMLLQYNSVVEAMASTMASLNAREWPEAVIHIEKHLNLLDAIVAKCKYELQPMSDAIKG